MKTLPTLAALSLAATPVLAGVQELWWNITYVQDANPDGLHPRRVIGVNGTWPPPPVSVSTEDSLVVHATNSVDQPATLHHHGMFFNSTSWMDGAQAVSQCGIPPGSTFTYTVPIATSGQRGTYWVHGHANGQYVDGLRAPLLLHPPAGQEAYAGKYDEEFTVVLGDWYHQEHNVLFAQFASVADPGGAEPVPDAALVYFAQNATYLPPLAGTAPTGPTASIGFNANASLPFTPGKTYRLRIINTSAFAAFYFWIDGHAMRVIEADGTDTQEFGVDMLMLAVAQRYSVLVTARNDTGDGVNWEVHANMDTTMFDTVPDTLQPNITAQITYSPTAPLTPASPPSVPAYIDTPDISLTPIPALPALPPATSNLTLLVSFDTMSNGINRAMFNSTTYQSPLVPAVLTALTMGEEAADSAVYGPSGQAFVFGEGEVVDLRVLNGDAGKHPFHIHGHKPQLIHRAANYSSDDPEQNPPLNNSQVNPMRRDTVAIPSGGSATFRFVVDNPGVWFFHCHIDWHLEVGLAVQLILAPALLQSRAASSLSNSSSIFPAPPYTDLNTQCAAQGLPFSGNAAGFNSTSDFEGLPVSPTVQVLGWKPKGIVAMTGCVLSAVIGMLTVIWYSLGGHLSEEQMEMEARDLQEAKAKRRRLFGLMPPKET